MSKRIFTKEQIEELLKNKNITKCSKRSITYNKDFKIDALSKYKEGFSPKEIFKDAGFDLDLIGKESPKYNIHRWKKTFNTKGIEYLSKETRGKNGGRPKSNFDNEKEKLKYLEHKIAYLEEENRFLKELRKQRGI